MGIRGGGLYGLYQGVPLTSEAGATGMFCQTEYYLPAPHRGGRRSPEEIEEILRDTVMHEIGHYFGFGDQELYEMEDEI